ncbi:MAG: Bor family protein [Acidobacteriia bacterium]|nr:Bor family protein [Terriglobia bacterium]
MIGLVGDTTLDVAQICPSGNATIEARRTFLNGLVTALTSGIYTPTPLRVRCQDGRTAGIPLGSDDVRRIAGDERFADWVGVDAPDLLSAVVVAQSLSSTH